MHIRFYRAVRALGFQQNAFEQATGALRYQWMRQLGNSRIGSGKVGTKIACPSAAEDLFRFEFKLTGNDEG